MGRPGQTTRRESFREEAFMTIAYGALPVSFGRFHSQPMGKHPQPRPARCLRVMHEGGDHA